MGSNLQPSECQGHTQPSCRLIIDSQKGSKTICKEGAGKGEGDTLDVKAFAGLSGEFGIGSSARMGLPSTDMVLVLGSKVEIFKLLSMRSDMAASLG
jgi:hypothetical protein